MAHERTICCCGASSWTKVIAWFQIVISVFAIIGNSISVVSIAAIDPNQIDIPYKSSVIAAIAISLVMSILGFIMGIILLKGTNQKSVGYLRAWLIYGIASILTSIVSLIINIIEIANADSYTIGFSVGIAILGIGINAFCVVVVYIHIKEINEGVFSVPKY